MRSKLPLFLLWFAFVACQSGKLNEEGLLVSIGENRLFAEDLAGLLPVGISSADSQLLADRYIQRWIDDRLLYEVAQKNVPNLPAIREKVEQYERELVIFEYQKQLVAEKLSEELTDAEVAAYYASHQNELVLDAPLVKGLLLQVRKNAPNIPLVRRWVGVQSAETLENIEKYSLKQGVNYRYFYNEYLPLEQIVAMLPSNIGLNSIREAKKYEFSDEEFYYFLNISEHRGKGEVMPLERATSHIREHLLKIKATQYLELQQQRLHKRAIEKKRIHYYYNQTKETND